MINIQSKSLDIMPDGVTSAEVPYANGNVGTNTPIGNMAWLNGQAADTKLPVNYWNWMLKQITKICLNISKYFTNLHTEVRNLILNTGPGILYPTNINSLAENNDNQLIEAVNNKITSMRTSCIAGKAVGGTTLGTVTSSNGSGKVSVDQNTGVMTANGLGDVAAGFTSLPTNVQTALASDKTMAGLMRVIFNYVYPVGTYYWTSVMSTKEQVAAAFGGTWERITSRFLYASADNNVYNGTITSNNSGGSTTTTVSLSAANIPAHYHGRGSQNITGTYGASQLTENNSHGGYTATGAFYGIQDGGHVGTSDSAGRTRGFGFDASRKWEGRSDGGYTAQDGGSAISGAAFTFSIMPLYIKAYCYRRIS